MNDKNLLEKEASDEIPRWIFWFALVVMMGAPLLFGVGTFLGAELGPVTLEDGSIIDTSNVKYAWRNLVAAGMVLFALYWRSARMLLLIFLMRFATEAGDGIDTILNGDLETTSLIIFLVVMVVVFLAPYTYGIRKLWNATS